MTAADQLQRALHPKITIIVEGGNVQEIMSNNPNVQIELIDYDNNPASLNEREKRFKEILKKNPYMLSIQ